MVTAVNFLKRNFIPKIVSDTSQSVAVYVLKVAFLGLCGAIVGGLLAHFLLPNLHPVAFKLTSPLRDFFLIVVGSPVVETLILAALIALVRLAIKTESLIALVCALIWAGLHSLLSPPWGFSVFVPFFMMTACYLAWEKISRLRAVAITILVHAAGNLLPALVMIATQIRKT